MSSPTQQTDRLREVVRQLGGIGGGRSLGMGPNRVRSLPDGIGQILDMYLRDKQSSPVEKANAAAAEEKSNNLFSASGGNSGHQTLEEEAIFQKMKIGDLCPECGEAAVVSEEGCRKCYACGYSEC